MKTFADVRHISVAIERSPVDVYAFAAEPTNLTQWAAGLSGSLALVDGEWVSESPMGTVKIRFVERNELGVLDHDVVLPSGESVHNAMRVIPNGEGSEVVFTLFRRPEMSDAEFTADADAITRDLSTLKALLEVK